MMSVLSTYRFWEWYPKEHDENEHSHIGYLFVEVSGRFHHRNDKRRAWFSPSFMKGICWLALVSYQTCSSILLRDESMNRLQLYEQYSEGVRTTTVPLEHLHERSFYVFLRFEKALAVRLEFYLHRRTETQRATA